MVEESNKVLENKEEQTETLAVSLEPSNPEAEEGYEKEISELVDVIEIRVLYKKCLKCRTLVPWAKNINSCMGDPECPARSITFIKGRDPRELIESMGKAFSKAIQVGDKEAFMATLKKMVQDGSLRTHIFESVCLAQDISSKDAQKAKDNSVSY